MKTRCTSSLAPPIDKSHSTLDKLRESPPNMNYMTEDREPFEQQFWADLDEPSFAIVITVLPLSLLARQRKM